MKFSWIPAVIAGLLMSACTGASVQAEAPVNTEGVHASEKRSSNVITDLYKSCAEEERDFIYSPYSLKSAFSILYPAADSVSKTQLESVFGFHDGKRDAIEKMNSEMVFQNGDGVKSVDKVFVNRIKTEKYEMHPEILGADDTDISDFDDLTCEKINQWIEDNTEGKIHDLISPDAVNKDTVSVLVNCLYFMMHWNTDENNVSWKITGKNIPSFSDTVSTDMVRTDGDINIIKLPYEKIDSQNELEHRYSMYVICSDYDKDVDIVDQYMQKLSDNDLQTLLDFSGGRGKKLSGYDEVFFNIPCFEMSNTFFLSDPLKNAGLTAPFDPETEDFTRFAPIYISQVIQGTYIKCDHTGTEAAAATAIMALENCCEQAPVKTKYVIADETFAFAIKDETSGEILFIGKVSEPEYKRN